MKSVRKEPQLSFLYPFDGRRKPLTRAGLFIFSPEVFMKLTDLSPQAAFKAAKLEPLFRRMQRAHEKHLSDSAAAKLGRDLLPHLDDSAFTRDLRLALDGDGAARQRLDKLTGFEAMFAGLGVKQSDYKLHHWFVILAERIGMAAARDLHAGKTSQAINRIVEHPVLSNLLWPEAREAFSRVHSERLLEALLASLTMECTLGGLAAWDRHLGHREGSNSSFFQMLFLSFGRPGRNPSSLFYDELQRRLGAKSIGALLSSRQGSRSSVEQWTLNRWSAGTHKPDFESVQNLLQAYGLNKPTEVLFSQFWATRQVHLLGFVGQTISNRAKELPESALSDHWPWPGYPHGHANFEA